MALCEICIGVLPRIFAAPVLACTFQLRMVNHLAFSKQDDANPATDVSMEESKPDAADTEAPEEPPATTA